MARTRMNLTNAEIQNSLRIHLAGNTNLEDYIQSQNGYINDFAQTKAFYVMQFITDDSEICYGSVVQRNVCTFLKVDNTHARRVWENGGMNAFRNGIGTKKKMMMYGVKTAINNCEYSLCIKCYI